MSKEWSAKIGKAGPVVIDNSSAWRMDPDVPLIVPEVNPDAVEGFRKKNIIANPNCSTIQLVVALKPLHDAAKIKRVVVSTYQSVSGAGKEGMAELWDQTKAIYMLGPTEPKKFPKQIAFNVIPFIGAFKDDGYTDEEQKMWRETHKMIDPSIKLTVTCVRVPVMVGHSEAVNIEFENALDEDDAREVLREAPGVTVIDKREDGGYITPKEAQGEHHVFVSRIRNDLDRAARPEPVGGLRQPAQGRGAERRADRRAAARARAHREDPRVTPASAAASRIAEERSAVLAGALCYLFWGFLPLLFKAAAWAGAGAYEIVAWRAVWSLLIVALLVMMSRGRAEFAVVLRSPRTLGLLCAAGLLIGANWTLFVVAVDSGHTLDASLAYYLNPLMSVAVGALLFRERIDRASGIAITLAAGGVAIQTVAHGALPLASLAMAVTFCAYGVIKKTVAVQARTGLLVECLVLAGPGLAYGLWAQSTGHGHATQPLAGLLLFLGGPATVAPLVTFAWAARRMPLATMGFLQFISPTMQFAIGVASGEALRPLNLLAFGCIWAGVAVYAGGAWRRTRNVD